jgi:hypothetical protein
MFRHTPLHVANLAENLLTAPLDAAVITTAAAALVEAATETVAEGRRREDGGRFLASALWVTESAATIAAARAAKASAAVAAARAAKDSVAEVTWTGAMEVLRRAAEDLRRL